MDNNKSIKRPIIGQSDFRHIRKNNGYYVDKSLFIRDIIECPYQAVLIPRPRRFGKTLNLSLLKYFFEKSDENRTDLFDGLEIQKHPVFKEHLGKYPVIFITFKDVKASNWEEQYPKLCHIILEQVVYHKYLLGWKELPFHISNCFNRILDDKATKDDYEKSLEYLSFALSLYNASQVVILIDEYDTPIHSGYYNDYYKDIISFMRNFLSGGFKDNVDLFKGVITGTLRISKESIFTGLNNLGVFTLLDDEFKSCFGFDTEELRSLLSDFSLTEYYDEMLKWYDGYNFGDKTILNPWSVINFVTSNKKEFKPYWLNTSGMEMIEAVLTGEKDKPFLRNELARLIQDQTIEKTIDDNVVMSDLKNPQNEIVWSFLLFSGYLKSVERISNNQFDNIHKLKIPNAEVKIIYRKLIKKWFTDNVDLSQLEDMLIGLQQGNIDLFEKNLKAISMRIMSFHDFSGSPEKVYHALVLGMLVWLSNSYEIHSNREAGLGRYDIMFKPIEQGRQGIIIEFKKLDDKDNPVTKLDQALKQINEKQYSIDLKASGISDILKIAVAFKGKEVFVKSENGKK